MSDHALWQKGEKSLINEQPKAQNYYLLIIVLKSQKRGENKSAQTQ